MLAIDRLVSLCRRARPKRGGTIACAAACAIAVCAVPAVLAEHLQVSDSGFGAYEVSLAPWAEGLVVAWYDTRDGNAEIYVRQLDAQGRHKGSEHRITHDPEQSYEADIDAASDGLAIAWYDKDVDGRLNARLAFWSPEDGLRWQRSLSIGERATRNPVVRAHAGERIFVAWIEQAEDGRETVRGAWWRTDGEMLEAPAELGPAGATTWNLNAAIDSDGVAYVVYDALVDTDAEELYLARVEGRDVRLARLTHDDGHRSKYPDLALSNGRAAITWFDERDGRREVYLYAGTSSELGEAVEARARRITETPGASIGAYVAWNGDRIGLAWCDDSFGAYDVYFGTFGAHGERAGEVRRVTETPEHALIPSIRAWNDGFALAWNEVAPGPSGMDDPATRSEVRFAVIE